MKSSSGVMRAKPHRRKPRSDEPTPPSEPGWGRRRSVLVVLAALAILVILVLWRGRTDKPSVAANGPDENAPPRPTSDWHAPSPTTAPSATAESLGVPPEPPPVIDSITLEKTSVCSGEENLVTVKAHTINSTDDYLHYVVDGQMGQAYPVRMFKTDRGLGKHYVSVFGRGNVVTTVPLPEYEVRDCKAQRVVNVETRLRANTWSDFDIAAKIVTLPDWNADPKKSHPPPPPFEPVSFEWTFGDGESGSTGVAAAQHNYEGRSQNAYYSYFVVGVTVRGKDGSVLTGRAALSLTNPAFEALAQKGIVVLMVSVTPRFPEVGSDGLVTQKVRLWHTRPGPVTLQTMTRTKYFEGASGEAEPELVPVASVLGTTIIPPGKDGITATLTLNPTEEHGVFSINYQLGGKSEEGYPVSGSFGIMRPPPAPTADNHDPVNDPLLKAKILAARAILGRNTVSDDDLIHLEREGRFANLTASSANANATARPPPIVRNNTPSQGPAVPTVHGPQAAPTTNPQPGAAPPGPGK